MRDLPTYSYPGSVPDEVGSQGPGVQKTYIRGYNARAKQSFRGTKSRDSRIELCVGAGWRSVRQRFFENEFSHWQAKKTLVPLKAHYESTDELPDDVRELPIFGMELWAATYNRSAASSNERRCNDAWRATKRIYYYSNDGKWRYVRRHHGKGRKIAEAMLDALHEGLGDKTLKLDLKGAMMKSRDPHDLDREWQRREEKRKERAGYFRFFVPFDKRARSGRGPVARLEKREDGFHVVGTASSDTLDRDGEIMSAAFVQKMSAMAGGLNVYEEHRYGLEHTVGIVAISDLSADGRAFDIDTHLEPEWDPVRERGNRIVTDIVMKLEHGTTLGYSVAGWVTKVEDIFYAEHGRKVPTIMDGELDEVSITSRPSNPDADNLSLVRAVKSFRGYSDDEEEEGDIGQEAEETGGVGEEDDDERTEKVLKHNSKLSPTEPLWGSVDKTKLPRNAHAVTGTAGKKATWKYPHHYVKGGGKLSDGGVYTTGDMFCHRGGVISAWSALMGARSGQRGPQAAIQHVQRHRKILGLEKVLAREGIELCVKCSADRVLKETELLGDLRSAIERLFADVDIRKLDDKRKHLIREAISEGASHIGSQLIAKVVSDLCGQEPYQQ